MDDKEVKTTGPSKYICFKLSKVMRKVQRYYESELAFYNITPVQFFVLNALWENDGIKFKDLARSVNMDGSTLTGVLDRMERGGFVERRNDPEDRRSLLVFLTDNSKKNGMIMFKSSENLDQEIKKQLSEEDFNLFVKVLDKLSQTE